MTTRRPSEDDPGPLEQRRALEALAAAGEVEAPERLRRRVEAERARAGPLARQRRRGFLAAAAVVVAALAASAVFLFPASVSDPTVIAEIARLHARSATLAPPRPRSATLLDLSVQGLSFPNLGRFGWRVGGMRTDTVRGRLATTVFYRKGSRRIGYTIVTGRPLTPPADARAARRGELDLATFAVDGRTVVTWQRSGLTAVLSGRRVAAGTLIGLASWNGGGTILP
jgi:hypothetical protein